MSYDPFLMSLVGFCRDMAKRAAKSDVDYKVAARLLNDGIFQQKAIKTGLASGEANRLKPSSRTPEHYFGRMASAKLILNKLIANPNRTDHAIYCVLKSRCRVHEVTGEQNRQLKSFFMANPSAHWRVGYQHHKILLVPRVVGKRGRKPKCSKT